jgi:hypothetical protein
MKLPPGLQHVIAETRLFTDTQSYIILRLPLSQRAEAANLVAKLTQPFVSLTRDKDEVTLVLPEEVWESQRPTLEVKEESISYRLITFDLPLGQGLVGYLAILSTALAEVGVSIFALSAFSRDHFFVPADDFEVTWETLRNLIRSCQIQEAAEDLG